MDYNRSSTASARDFESTAVKKLVAEGVPRDVAYAFVSIGIMQKSQDYARIRDLVCPMQYQEYFIPRSIRDVTDPLRVGGPGALVPHVVSNKQTAFYTEFAMNDVESVRFIKSFPEFKVIIKGKTFNQHAYYANKRYAEAELLVSMVHKHSLRSEGAYDPTSITDLGGNRTMHEKRGRPSVHCDNPTLSARDAARYTVREIFSGEDSATRCSHSFQDCSHASQYGIAVHSTYDLTPKKIAHAMLSKNMVAFYGVINIVPDIQNKPAGVYESDGLIATVVRPPRQLPYVKYSFKYDSSLEYVHKLADVAQYFIMEKKYQFVTSSGFTVDFLYKVESVRGAALVFSIHKSDVVDLVSVSNSVWSAPRAKNYDVSIPRLGVDRLSIDCELFDRLVMEAAGSRNFKDYDIVSLFRYAKSLRQRVSINNVVLSSGFCLNPEDLVNVVIAAYAVAASFRVQSSEYFRGATSQIMNLRPGQSIFRNIVSLASAGFSAIFSSLSGVISHYSFYSMLNQRMIDAVKNKFPIIVQVDKPHAGRGMEYVPEMLSQPPTSVPSTELVRQGSLPLYTPLRVGGFASKLVPTTLKCSGERKVFYSAGIPALHTSELARDCSPVFYDLEFETRYPVRSEEFKVLAYSALKKQLGINEWSQKPLLTVCGDSVYRKAPFSDSEAPTLGHQFSEFVSLRDQYVVFRGVGSKAVSLGKPKAYGRGVCVNFVLFYECDDTDLADYVSYSLKKFAEPSLPSYKSRTVSSPPSVAAREWSELLGNPLVKGAVRYANSDAAREAVREDVEAGFFTMTGAIPHDDALVTPPFSYHSTPVGSRGTSPAPPVTKLMDAAASVAGDPAGTGAAALDLESPGSVVDSVVDFPPVSVTLRGFNPPKLDWADDVPMDAASSSTDQFARLSMLEFITACESSEKVAIQSTLACFDMAMSTVNGDVSRDKFLQIATGLGGSPVIVRVFGDKWTEYHTDESVEHMAVSDGKRVYDRLVNKPSDGYYVTSEVMRVYTGAAIKHSVQSVLDDSYVCDVIGMNGVAGSGKTYSIVHEAKLGDVVLCETADALRDTGEKLKNTVKGWDNSHATVDSFLCNRQFSTCDVLWVDESYRLHSAKIWAVMKLLRPTIVYCFGDSEQIPVLPYDYEFDFSYHEFPFTRMEQKRDSWRCPADVAMALSVPDYYGFVMTTHNKLLRSVSGPRAYDADIFLNKPQSVVLLTYTKTGRDDLRKAGVKNVITIGQSQGSTYQDVMLFRDTPLRKALYYDRRQTLVAFTRHTRSFLYVTAAIGSDDSEAYEILRYLQERQSELLLRSHVVEELDDSDRASSGEFAVGEGFDAFVEVSDGFDYSVDSVSEVG